MVYNKFKLSIQLGHVAEKVQVGIKPKNTKSLFWNTNWDTIDKKHQQSIGCFLYVCIWRRG